MGALFRSEPMTLCQLFIQTESSYNCVKELGELGLVQFRDLNPEVNAFQRKFVNEIRRCDEMERKLRFLEKEMKKDEIPFPEEESSFVEAPQPKDMIDLEASLERLEQEIKEINSNTEILQKNFNELTELKYVLRKAQVFFEEVGELQRSMSYDRRRHTPEEKRSLLEEDSLQIPHSVQLGFVSGVIQIEKLPAFERMLWRVCRGNVFIRHSYIEDPIQDPITGDEVYKTVFIVFFQGEQLKHRIKKICEGFRATLYPCPAKSSERREMAIGVMTRIEDLNIVFNRSKDHRMRVLANGAKSIRSWFVQVRKIKAIYHTLDLFNLDVTQKCLIAECWCPERNLGAIQLALRRGTDASGSSVACILNRMETTEPPPTFNRLNKFTQGFQNIVNAYGVANYREVNPAPYTIITFPFLFAVMFGDAGHGLIMFLFALFLVLKEKALKKMKGGGEIWDTFFNGRYIILLMGAFSIYTGLIYNDVFSKSFNIFGTSWIAPNVSFAPNVKDDPVSITFHPVGNYSHSPYPFGLDPVWQLAKNKIPYTNSYKMKMAIILGVSHMLFGVILNIWNHLYFKDQTGLSPPLTKLEGTLRRTLNIWSQLIPEILFLVCLFGYLVALIIFKWLSELGSDSSSNSASCSRSLLIMFINMFLFTYSSEPCYQANLYTGQKAVQTILIVVAVLCIPWLLLVKPFFLMYLEKKHKSVEAYHEFSDELPWMSSAEHQEERAETEENENARDLEDEDKDPDDKSVSSVDSVGPSRKVSSAISAPSNKPDEKHKTELNKGDMFINQAIHTIEYCLGAISNTASYLRLWALSLAHAQLSEVLWTMVMKMGISNKCYGFILTFPIFIGWAVLTIAVLLVMEGLSAFLHALRLHWVEFQNKFYKGEGYLFVPFSFEAILSGSDEEF